MIKEEFPGCTLESISKLVRSINATKESKMSVLRNSKLGAWWLVPLLLALVFGQISPMTGLVSILPFLMIEF